MTFTRVSKEGIMISFTELRELGLADVRKAIAKGKVEKTTHAKDRARERRIDSDDYLRIVMEDEPVHVHPGTDAMTGLPMVSITTRFPDGSLVVGCFTRPREKPDSEWVIFKTVFEHYGRGRHFPCRQHRPTAMEAVTRKICVEAKDMSTVKVVAKKEHRETCVTCVHQRRVFSKSVCDYHRIMSETAVGITSVNMIIAIPGMSSCEHYSGHENRKIPA